MILFLIFSMGFRGTSVFIVPDAYFDRTYKLKVLRTIEGYDVKIIKLSDIGSNSPEEIKGYIFNHIPEWTKPIYITLIGDVEIIPGETLGYRYSDQFYILPDEFSAPDTNISIGRLSVHLNAYNTLDNIIEKLWNYEFTPLTDGWSSKIIGVATCQIGDRYDQQIIRKNTINTYLYKFKTSDTTYHSLRYIRCDTLNWHTANVPEILKQHRRRWIYVLV